MVIYRQYSARDCPTGERSGLYVPQRSAAKLILLLSMEPPLHSWQDRVQVHVSLTCCKQRMCRRSRNRHHALWSDNKQTSPSQAMVPRSPSMTHLDNAICTQKDSRLANTALSTWELEHLPRQAHAHRMVQMHTCAILGKRLLVLVSRCQTNHALSRVTKGSV